MDRKNNELIIIPKIEKYIEYMLVILLKLPRTEKFSIGTELKTSMYEMLKYALLASKVSKKWFLHSKYLLPKMWFYFSSPRFP